MEVRDAYLIFIQNYCNNKNLLDEELISLVIDKMIDFDAKTNGVKSESLGDYSATYETDYPRSILRLLAPLKRVRFI